jgi:hypothetical protein
MEAGHDRSDRYPRNLSDLAVMEPVQLAHNNHLAPRRRERLDELVETPQIRSTLQQRLGINRSCRNLAAEFSLRVERGDIRWPIAGKPAVAGVPDDLKQPAFGIAAVVAGEITKRSQKRFLHDIARIGIVARQPSRQGVSGVEMRQCYPLKPLTTTPIHIPRQVPGLAARCEIVRQWEIFLVEGSDREIWRAIGLKSLSAGRGSNEMI